MESSRDSSIWRSLAVAFGDGVAFGVGVKLAQGAARPPADAPPAELSPFAGRLEQLERRLATIEHAPPRAASGPAPFDQKVLEAVVNALDARLHEQSGQVERRLTELEAKLTIELKTLDQQDHSLASGLQTQLEEVHGQYNQQVIAIRDAVAQDMDTLYGQLAQLRQEFDCLGPVLEARIAEAVSARITATVNSHAESMEVRLRRGVVEAVDQAAQRLSLSTSDQLQELLTPVRQALGEKDREISELRQRIAESDQTVLDLILAMGQMCRQVAERISTSSQPTAQASTPEPPTSDPPNDAAPSGDSSPEPPAEPSAADNNGRAHIELAPTAPADDALPSFAQVQRPSRLWRVPLVSSFLMLAAAGLWLLK